MGAEGGAETLAETSAVPDFWEVAVEFVGLTEAQARALAAERELLSRDLTPPVDRTTDLTSCRFNVWLERGVVARAVIF